MVARGTPEPRPKFNLWSPKLDQSAIPGGRLWSNRFGAPTPRGCEVEGLDEVRTLLRDAVIKKSLSALARAGRVRSEHKLL